MTVFAHADYGAVGHIQRRKQRGCAVALVVVSHRSAAAFLQRQAGLGAVQGLDLTLLVDAHHDRVLRWMQIEPHDIFQFLGKTLVLADLKLSKRCGFSPLACQMRRTVASLMPISAAIIRVLQWVALNGLACVVLRTTSAFSRAPMAGLRPGRGASLVRPSSPPRKNRLRHRAAFWLEIRRAAAISRSV